MRKLLASEKKQPILISFSGMDGAGKSTQIDALVNRLRAMGLRVQLITFWNDVATLTRFRESAGHAIFRGDKGVGSPSAPIERRDKNVRSPLMTCVRLCLYFLDALSLRRVTKAAFRSDSLVVFDRYVYDEIVNLPLHRWFARVYTRLLLRVVPRPHLAFVLDADPVEARRRKPEYPLEFLRLIRNSYLSLSESTGALTVIPPSTIDEAEREIFKHTLAILSNSATEHAAQRLDGALALEPLNARDQRRSPYATDTANQA